MMTSNTGNKKNERTRRRNRIYRRMFFRNSWLYCFRARKMKTPFRDTKRSGRSLIY
jgi:hypothetical protein